MAGLALRAVLDAVGAGALETDGAARVLAESDIGILRVAQMDFEELGRELPVPGSLGGFGL